MSRGEKEAHCANQLDKVKSYKVTNVNQLGKLITKKTKTSVLQHNNTTQSSYTGANIRRRD